MPLRSRFASADLYRMLGTIDRFDLFASSCEMQSETAGGSEAIECIAVRVLRCGYIIFSLIEIDSGLLPVHQIGVPAESVHR